MRSITGWIGAGLVLVAIAADAQTTVYKCETANGTVYSGQPCQGSHKEVLHLREVTVTDQAEVARRAAVREEASADSRQRALARQELNCIENRTVATRLGTQRRIEAYQRQINQLRASPAYTSDDLSRATWSTGIGDQIAALQNAISNEKRILAQTVLNARSICAERHRASVASYKRP